MAGSSAGVVLTNTQEANLAKAIEQQYGFQVTQLKRLGGELDLNFKAVGTDGELRFVRLTPAGFDVQSIEWQNSVLAQLAKQPLSVQTPALISQIDGAIMSVLDLGEGLQGTMRMTTWVSGVNVADLGATGPDLRFQIGSLAAEVIESLKDLKDAPNNEYEHHWMVIKSGDSIRSTIDAVDDPERRKMLEESLTRFEQIADRIPELPCSVVHQDLHDFNLLAQVDAEGTTTISGVVDFNDAVFTAKIAELAVAAVYAGLRQENPFQAFCEVVEGYLSRATIQAVELELLYPLAVARLAVNASTWTARGKVGNTSYAESRTEATWPALREFLSITPEEAVESLRELTGQRSNQPLERI